ncbi:hypothetical protein Mapa_004080 [Marchantia paleacea]|nr:hypothetical protein Mapa_004080 [Marchantia paleacea]
MEKERSAASSPSSISWRWVWGVIYIILVALIWIVASFVVQSVVDSGVSPFLITYICNSLFVVYIPIVEGSKKLKSFIEREGWSKTLNEKARELCEKIPEAPQIVTNSPERQNLLENGSKEGAAVARTSEEEVSTPSNTIEDEHGSVEEGRRSSEQEEDALLPIKTGGAVAVLDGGELQQQRLQEADDQPWSRKRTALVGLTICPFWFLAQLTFNLSLKYTTVTSNTILSTASSLFTLLVSVKFLGEKFTWVKLVSVLLCMSGSIFVAVGDSWNGKAELAPNAVLGDVICLSSAMFYATYTALIRVKIPDEDDGNGKCSTALVLGYIGLFNGLIFGPIALFLHFSGIEPFHRLTLTQFGLIVGKGLIDNVLSDYLWARAVLLTTPTAATAGLTIQVPIAAVIDSVRGIVPSPLNVLGAIAVLIGFFGINQSPVSQKDEKDVEKVVHTDEGNLTTVSPGV